MSALDKGTSHKSTSKGTSVKGTPRKRSFLQHITGTDSEGRLTDGALPDGRPQADAPRDDARKAAPDGTAGLPQRAEEPRTGQAGIGKTGQDGQEPRDGRSFANNDRDAEGNNFGIEGHGGDASGRGR